MHHNKHYRDSQKKLIARCEACNTVTERSRTIKTDLGGTMCKRCVRDRTRADNDANAATAPYALRDNQVEAWLDRQPIVRPTRSN